MVKDMIKVSAISSRQSAISGQLPEFLKPLTPQFLNPHPSFLNPPSLPEFGQALTSTLLHVPQHHHHFHPRIY